MRLNLIAFLSSLLFVFGFGVSTLDAQCGSNTTSGTNCTRNGPYAQDINVSACGAFTTVTNYSPATYFRTPVLNGGCYSVSTCGASINTQISAYQGNATTNPFAYNNDNGPLCTGTAASINMVPNFTDFARVDVSQFNCRAGGTASITVRVRQNNNLTFTSSGAAMCEGETRIISATPAPTTVFGNAGDPGTYSGTGVIGTTFTAPTPVGASQIVTLTYTFGFCNATQNITVFRNPSPSNAGPDQTVSVNNTTLAATAPIFGTGTWTVINGTGVFSNANDPAATVTGLSQGINTFRWTITNGPCTSTSNDVIVTLDGTPPSITCPGNQTGVLNAGCAFSTPNYISLVTTSDAVDPNPVVTQDPAPGTILSGDTTITMTSTDFAGNAASCTFTVAVSDTTPPVIVCPSPQFASVDSNCLFTIPDYTQLAGISDNCTASPTTSQIPPANITISVSGGSLSFPITVNAVDAAGNSSSCQFQFTLSDDTDPVAVCQNITIGLSGGSTTITGQDVDGGSSDNCTTPANLIYSVTPNTFTSANTGPNPVILTVTDENGNSSNCTAVVTIADTIPPVAVCQDVTLALDGSGNATLTPGQVDNGSSDNQGIGSLALSQTNFTCADLGSNTVDLIVTDVGGNTDTCTANITIEDNTAPNAICQDVTVILDGAGNGTLGAAQVDNGSTDNCGISSITISDTSFTCADAGVNTVTLTLTDGEGNTANCTAQVTVIDTVAPTAICQDLTLNLVSSGNVSITTADIDNGSSDLCGIDTLFLSQNSFTCADIGSNTVTLTAQDGSGNTSTCTANVTVLDTTAPTVICQDVTITLDNFGNGIVPASMLDGGSSDACGIASVTSSQALFSCADVVNLSPPSVNDCWINEIHYDNAGADSAEFVEIAGPAGVDLTGTRLEFMNGADGLPYNVINLSGTLPNQSNGFGTLFFSLAGIQNGAPDGVIFGIGNTAIDAISYEGTFSALGGSFTGTVMPDIGVAESNSTPTMLSLQLTGSGASGSDFTWTGPSSFSPGAINTGQSISIGALTGTGVTLVVTDNNGNVDSCTAYVTVIDTLAPVANCNDDTIYLDASGQGLIAINDIASFTDVCGIDTLFASADSLDCGDLAASPLSVTVTATDSNGNTSNCTVQVTVIDSIAPVATCPSPIVVGNDSGQCGANVTWSFNATDNCNIANTTNSANPGDFFNVGTTTVSYQVTDDGGNTDSCSFSVTVNDAEAPVAVCPPSISVSNDSGDCGASVSWAFSSSDNCGIANTINQNNPGDFFNIGTSTVDYTVLDSAGNADSCSFTITVSDGEAPVVVCPAPITQNNDSGQCASVVTWPTVNATDNCGVDSLFSSQMSGATFPVGTSSVTYFATDTAGNIDTCMFSVTVNDAEAPQITCPAGSTVLADTATCTGVATWGPPTATDNCGIDTVIGTHASGNSFPIGTTQVVLTALDSSGNLDSCSFSVTVNAQPMAASLSTSLFNCGHGVSCNGSQDGSATVTAAGGCQPYSFSWSSGDTTATAGGLGAGIYTVTVTDGLGGSIIDSVVITEPAPITYGAVADSVACAGDSSANIDLSVNGGNDCQAYTYSWSTGDTTEDLSNVPGGTYIYTVTDVSGCSITDSVTILSQPAPILDFGPDTTVCPGPVVLQGGNAVSYQWSTGDTTPSITVTNPGDYGLTITDGFGCSASDSINIGYFTASSGFISPRDSLQICQSDTIELDGGTGFSAYNWSTGSVNQTTQVTGVGGFITLIATDANGCENADSVFVDFINQPNPTPVIDPGPTYNLCDGNTVNLEVVPSFSTYDWSTGDDTQVISVSSAGTYSVTVTDAQGCVGSSTPTTVTVVPLPTPTIVNSGDTLLSVNGTYSSYQWNNNGNPISGATFATYTVTSMGVYSVTVLNSDSCEGTSDVVTVTPPVSAEAGTQKLLGIEIFPNPTQGMLYVRSLNPIDTKVDLTVMDMYGKVVRNLHVNNLRDTRELDLTDLANGMYLIKVEDDKGRAAMMRFMIE